MPVARERVPHHWRKTRERGGAATLYLSGIVAPAELQILGGGSIKWNNYLIAGGEVIGMRRHHNSQGSSTLYFHKDHFGSISTLTNATGVVTERLSYDPWGNRRNADGTDDPSGAILACNSAPTTHWTP